MGIKKILLVDDEDDVLELMRFNLEKEGYAVEIASCGETGLAVAKASLPSLVVLDLMLPGMDGFEICRRLKSDRQTQHIPIIMLTARGAETDIVTGLEAGADDYMTKPFSIKILVARIRRVLDRAANHRLEESAIRIYDLVIEPPKRRVTACGEPVDLTFTEFNILLAMAKRPGMVFTRYQIIDAIHSDDYLVTDRAVDVQIVGLRKKLGKCGSYIQTVRGVGYRLKE